MANEYSPSKAMTEEAQAIFETESITVRLSPRAADMIRTALLDYFDNGRESGDEFKATIYMFNRIVEDHPDE